MARPRTHPPLRVGDKVGIREVVRLLPTDDLGNERVNVKCVCGNRSSIHVYNLRKTKACRSCSTSASRKRMVRVDPGDVRVLLDVLAPKCWNCARPATRYLGGPYADVPRQEHACDRHQREGVRYSDLPAAAVIRRITAMFEVRSEAAG